MTKLAKKTGKEIARTVLRLLRATTLQCMNLDCAHNMQMECTLRHILLSKKGRCMNIIDKKYGEPYKEAKEK